MSDLIKSENEELKNLIDGYSFSKNKILAKVIVDHDSPFLKTIIINKGSKENIKIGTNIYDRSYLVGRVIEVNYTTSRVLLLSDLNSSVPVSITPSNIQAIIVGTGDKKGELKYVKGNFIDEIENRSIAYTSGTGSIFQSGKPVGRIEVFEENNLKKILINFYSDFTQLKYVYAEVENQKIENETTEEEQKINELNTEKIKLDLINEELEIFKESNLKFEEENKKLKNNLNNLNIRLLNLQKKNNEYQETINNEKIDQEELEFLRLNLLYSNKCQSKKLFSTGYNIGSKEYKDCIMNKGKKNRKKVR